MCVWPSRRPRSSKATPARSPYGEGERMLHPSDDRPPRQATLASWQANRHCAGKEEKQQRQTSFLFFLLHLECTGDNVHGESDDGMEQISLEGSRSRNSRPGSYPWLVIFGASSSDASILICDDRRGPRPYNRRLKFPLLRAPEAIHRPWLIPNSRRGLEGWRSCR